MSRALWFAAGAGAGVWAMVKTRRTAESLTAEGLEGRWAGVRRGWQVFAEEVRAGMSEKEIELRRRVILDADAPRALGAGEGRTGQAETPAQSPAQSPSPAPDTRGEDEH